MCFQFFFLITYWYKKTRITFSDFLTDKINFKNKYDMLTSLNIIHMVKSIFLGPLRIQKLTLSFVKDQNNDYYKAKIKLFYH